MATHWNILAWNLMERGAWQATVHGVTKSQIQLKGLSTYAFSLAEDFALLFISHL